MPIYVIGGQKGGTGKSTVATNLAVSLTRRGRSPLLVDADRQLTASHWSAERQSGTLTPITTVQKTGKLFRDLQALSERFEDVIVDAGGYDSVELRTALVAADHLYSPVKASQSDLWTLEAMSQLLGEARELNPRLGAHLLLSMAPTHPTRRATQDALGLLSQYEAFDICRTVIRQRTAFEDAMRQGRGVVELADGKATLEVESFTTEVMVHVGIQSPQALAS